MRVYRRLDSQGDSMAERYDGRFDELTGLVQKVVGRVDELRLEMRDMRKDVQTHAAVSSSRFDNLEVALEVVSARQDEVIPKVIGIQKHVNRISDTQTEQSFKVIELLNRVDDVDRNLNKLGERTVEMDSEMKELKKTIMSLIDPILDGKTLWANIGHVEERLARLEEKVG
jgi:chromosome segregation ATPase